MRDKYTKELLAVIGYFVLHTVISLAVTVVAVVIYQVFVAGVSVDLMTSEEQAMQFLYRHNNLIVMCANLLAGVAVFIISRAKRRPFALYTGLNAKMPSPGVGFLCVLAGIAGNFWFSFVLNSGLISADMLSNYETAFALVEGGNIVIEALSIVIVAPVVEELLFRGVIMHHMRNIMPAGAAIVLQGMLFGCLHGDPLWIIYSAVLGCIIGYIRVRCGTLRAAIIFHVAFNAASYAFMAFANRFENNAAALGIGFVASAVLFLGAVIGIRNATDVSEA